MNLSELVRHLRNAIAHGRINFKAEKQSQKDEPLKVKGVVFSDCCAKNKKTGKPEEFEIYIPIELLREFMIEFAKAVAMISLENNN